MTAQSYKLRLDNSRIVDVTLPVDEPLYRVVERLVQEHGLPITDQQGRRITYALYAGYHRRLSSEMSLRQAGQDQGGELCLANVYAPWWEQTPAATRRLFGGQPARGNQRPLLYALIGAGAVIALLLVVVAALLLTMLQGPTSEASSRTSVPGRQAGLTTTSTLAPLPTALPATSDQPAPTSTLLPTMASPTSTLAPAAERSPTSAPAGMAAPATATSPPSIGALLPGQLSNPQPLVTATLVKPDESVIVAGVKREYLDRDSRLFFQGRTAFGAYLWEDAGLRTRKPASQGSVVVSNGDRVAILSQANGVAQVRIVENKLDPADPKVIGATGYLPVWLITDQGVPPPPPTATPRPGKLFVYKLNENDAPGCISMRITGINASGWSFVVDGANLRGRFDNAGNARLCGLGADQEVTISVLDRNGRIVPGGRGVPAKGRAIMIGEWRQQ